MVKRREVITGIGGGLVLAGCNQVLPASSKTTQPGLSKPNILLIVMDQERSFATIPDTLPLPVRRKLAKESLNFTNYHVNSVPCAPARAIIWTGQHTQRTGVISNPGHAGSRELSVEDTPSIPLMLKSLGYKTALKGKWHLSDLSRLKGKGALDGLQSVGYDEWQTSPDTFGKTNEGAGRDQLTAEDAVEYLNRQAVDDEETPWFLTVNFINPHDVMWYDATGEQHETRLRPGYVSKMADSPDRAPFNQDLGFALPPSYYKRGSKWPYAHSAYKQINDIFYGVLPDDDEAAYQRVQNFYFNCLRDSEKSLNAVLQGLQDTGQHENTIVILTSDHGEMAGAHRQRNKGPFMFKENLNVPLIIRDPRNELKGEQNRPCSSIDIAPTILNYAGLTREQIASRYPDLKGESLAPVVGKDGSSLLKRDEGERTILLQFNSLTHTNPKIFAERIIESAEPPDERSPRIWPDDDVQFEVRGFGRGVFDGRYKFCRWFSPADHHLPEDWYRLVSGNDLELIDTYEDPDEVINLAEDLETNKDLILRMNEKLNEIIKREVGVDDGSYLPGPPSTWTNSYL